MAWHISANGGTLKAKITAYSSTLSGLDYLRTSVKQLVAIYISHTHTQINSDWNCSVQFIITMLAPFNVFQARLQTYDLTTSVLCSPSDVPEGGFPNSIPMVMRGNCTFYEKVRLAQMNGAKGLLIVSKDRLVRLYNTINSTIKTFSHVSQISLSDMLYRLLPQATSPSMRR